MKNLKVLAAARAAIATPEQWVRHIRRIHRPGGFAYCALGAIDSAGVDADKSPATIILEGVLSPAERELALKELAITFRLESPSKCSIVAQFNNTHSHDEVLAAFDKAIERCRTIDGMATIAPARALLPAHAEHAGGK